MIFWIFLDFFLWDFSNSFAFFEIFEFFGFFWIFLSYYRLLLNVTEVTTDHQKLPKFWPK